MDPSGWLYAAVSWLLNTGTPVVLMLTVLALAAVLKRDGGR